MPAKKHGEECDFEPWHGMARGYIKMGCRGKDCSIWNAARQAKARAAKKDGAVRGLPGAGAVEMGNRRVVPGKDELICPCACEKKMLSVSKSMIKAGHTLSCGRSGCEEI